MAGRLKAQRLLRDHGQRGNWRFKGLLLANLPGSPVSRTDVAKAWPTQPSEYRFLQDNPRYDADEEKTRRAVVEEGSDEYHMLSDFADDELSELNEGVYEADLDRSIQHTLFAAATPEEVDTLFRNQIADVVAEGARRRQMARDGSFVFNADTNQGNVTVAEDRAYQYEDGSDGIAEGGIIPDEREDYSTVSWDCVKVGTGARITDEMVRHARVDLIERQVEWVGAVAENDMNRIWINALVDGANQQYDTTGSSLNVSAVNGAITQVDKQDFVADSLVTHPGMRQELFDDSNLVYVNRSADEDPLRNRELGGPLMGLEHYPMNDAAYDSSTNTFGAGDDELAGVAYQRDHIWLVIEQDIEVKDYEDPIRDLQGVNSRAWVDATYAQPDAAATIKA
jgi:hypothetical protein